ncbi:MAG: 50S ribosomal protein L20 [Verrucomicrobiota bacterium]|nr:50S ribosomal protein L20 [Verrucomicrobiota bacterium]
MVRATNAVAAHKRRKRLLKNCKGYYGDRKNHIKLSRDAEMSAMANNYRHRKLRKRDFRSLWISRIGVAAKLHGISYSKLMQGLKKSGCVLNRKWLSQLAISDPAGFGAVVASAQAALVA